MPHTANAFQVLCRIEPRLRSLFEKAKRTSSRRWYAWLSERGRWHVGLVETLEVLVGFSAEKRHPDLVTSSAYDAAYEAIYSVLRPDKRFAMPSVEELLAEARNR